MPTRTNPPRTHQASPAEEAPAGPALDRTLTYRMHLLHKLSEYESQRLYPASVDLSMSDGRCLSVVGSFPSVSVNQLAQLANLNKAQASRAAQSLVDQGLVRKADSPGDGRGVELSLTPRGRTAWRKTMAFIARRNEAIFGCLSAQEQQVLGDMFDRLIAHNNTPSAD